MKLNQLETADCLCEKCENFLFWHWEVFNEKFPTGNVIHKNVSIEIKRKEWLKIQVNHVTETGNQM